MTDKPREIDCQEALDRLYEYLDEELTPELADEVQRHLEACAPCLKLAAFESAYLRFLEARARASEVPEALKRRVLELMLFDSGEPDS